MPKFKIFYTIDGTGSVVINAKDEESARNKFDDMSDKKLLQTMEVDEFLVEDVEEV